MGERIYPNASDLFANLQHQRHLAAYAFASKLCIRKRVLEAGCGAGYGTAFLSQHAGHILGVDRNPEAIKYAAEHYIRQNLEFRQMDFQKMDFPPSSFDVVVSFQVLEHLTTPDQFLQNVKKILKAEGVLLLTTPNRCLRLNEGEKPWNPFHEHEYDAGELSSLLKKYFNRVDITGLFGKDNAQELEVTRVNPHAQKFRFRTVYDRLQHALVITDVFRLRRLLPKELRMHINSSFEKRSVSRRNAYIDKVKLTDFFVDQNCVNDSLDLVAVCRN